MNNDTFASQVRVDASVTLDGQTFTTQTYVDVEAWQDTQYQVAILDCLRKELAGSVIAALGTVRLTLTDSAGNQLPASGEQADA
jgi:hypothetical protein